MMLQPNKSSSWAGGCACVLIAPDRVSEMSIAWAPANMASRHAPRDATGCNECVVGLLNSVALMNFMQFRREARASNCKACSMPL